MGPIFVGARTGADNRQASWAPPVNRGDGAITGYEYRTSTDGGATWSPDWAATGSLVGGRSFTFTALPGSSYTIEARAVSDAAHQRGAVRSVGPPQNAPKELEVILYTSRVDLFWDAPPTTAARRSPATRWSTAPTAARPG